MSASPGLTVWDAARRGPGLGLAIACAVVEAHHGRIELASEPGKGATFTMVLPTGKLE